MSDIQATVKRLDASRDTATLKLINDKKSSFILAVFRLAFPQQTTTVRVEVLHAQVEAYIAELAGTEDAVEVPAHFSQDQIGRSFCRHWLNEKKWLRRLPAQDGGEVYELTSAAIAAQRIIDSIGQDRTVLSESRLSTIVEKVREAAADASPDRTAQLAFLETRIAADTAERDRIAEGGALLTADDDRMIEMFTDLRDLLSQLPGDFRRVMESQDRLTKTILADFRSDTRPKGVVLDEYLSRANSLTNQTPEGRAFEGALTILSNETLISELRTNLRTIMGHSFSNAVTADERESFMQTARLLEQGLDDVLSRRHKATRVVTENLRRHDATEERELTNVMARLDHELTVWMSDARPKARVPMPWMPSGRDMLYLNTRFYDPAADRPVAPLSDVAGDAPVGLSLAEARRFGAPLTREVLSALAVILRSVGEASLMETFNRLPISLRRSVELFGLIQVCTDLGLTAQWGGDTDVADAIQTDGTTRRILFPRFTVTADQLATTQEGTRP